MARAKIKPDIDESQMVNNPFTYSPEFQVKVREFDIKTDLVAVENIVDGVITAPPASLTQKLILEDEPYGKYYLTASLRKIVMGCTPKAKDLLFFIMYELEHQQDWLWINKDRYLKESNVSLPTYKAAIFELDRYGIIKPSLYKDTYWVNPMFFFRGDRIKKYPKKLKSR